MAIRSLVTGRLVARSLWTAPPPAPPPPPTNDWDQLAVTPLHRSLFVVALPSLAATGEPAARLASTLRTLCPGPRTRGPIVAVEATPASLRLDCTDPGLPVCADMRKFANILFLHRETINAALLIARSHPSNPLIKAIDTHPHTLLHPPPNLRAPFHALTSGYSLAPTPPRIRTTALASALYTILTNPPFLNRNALAREDPHAIQTRLRAWTTFHPKLRHTLLDMRAALLTHRLHALVLSGEEVPVVAVLSHALAGRVCDLWETRVVPALIKGSAPVEYLDGEGGGTLLRDDLEWACGMNEVGRHEEESAEKVSVSKVEARRPDVKVILGSRPVAVASV